MEVSIMGSCGVGNFGDYDLRNIGNKSSEAAEVGGGGQVTDFNCTLNDVIIRLEDVATSEFFNTHGILPKIGTAINVKNSLEGGRLVVVNEQSENLGNLPTRYQYLYKCISMGSSYFGEVIDSKDEPIKSITVVIRNA